MPCALGLAAAATLASLPRFGLARAERVTVAVECAYQNVGIATTVALNMFEVKMDRVVYLCIMQIVRDRRK
jgi:predicted Na+-dependent transporter